MIQQVRFEFRFEQLRTLWRSETKAINPPGSNSWWVFRFPTAIDNGMSSKKSDRTTKFHIEFKSAAQKMAWAAFQQHDVLFLSGSPGAGKTFLATAFAISELLGHRKKNIIMTRPIQEAGERLGFLPGDFKDKVDPYMYPLYDCLTRLVGSSGAQRLEIDNHVEIAPLALMRGRTFSDSICILDEAQNCTKAQLKMFLTRMGTDSKLIITGDPDQSDIPNSGLREVIQKLSSVKGIGIIEFDEESIVRHPIIKEIVRLI